MIYSLYTIRKILTGETTPLEQDQEITELIYDSRKIINAPRTLFIALISDRRDGHDFIPDAYAAGVRAFLISTSVEAAAYPDAFFIQVSDTLVALQQLAAHHRARFNFPVIGITGSNGKTIVKEWLYQLLRPDFSIVRSPRSYNSQIGVPLSVWQMDDHHSLGIFEAGISLPGEMQRLEKIIRPTIGILTNIGAAHDEGFSSRSEKEREKRILFSSAVMPDPIDLKEKHIDNGSTRLTDVAGESIVIPFTDDAAVENALTCWALMRHLGYGIDIISSRMRLLQPVQMRLEIKRGINQCLILNDAYSMDLDSLSIALAYLKQQSGELSQAVVLTDLPEGGHRDYEAMFELLLQHKVSRLIAIGPALQTFLQQKKSGSFRTECYPSREAFEAAYSAQFFNREAILLKGARRFEMEKILPLLEAQLHQTRLEVDLGALRHNIRSYQSVLKPGVKIMAMVKSFAYGSGGVEVARVMQQEGVAYLGVAYADEGVALRRAGIRMPIMVMNTEPDAFEAITEHRLEPVMYSIELVRLFQQYLSKQGERHFPVHFEIETGMNRLGIAATDFGSLLPLLSSSQELMPRSVFSHLTAGEDPSADRFTQQQFDRLQGGVKLLHSVYGNTFLCHLANSAAAIRQPDWQLDMVRIGIGLYGIDPVASERISLKPVARLLATVAQIKDLTAGEAVSYNRTFIADRPIRIATIRLGYADGYPRRLGNGVGYVLLQGKSAPVVGTVCMDMFMVDITNIPAVQVGDLAIVFGPELSLSELAKLAGTIPYEIMTGISQRVKRVYVEES